MIGRRWGAAAAAMSMLVAVSACGDDDDDATSASPAVTSTAAAPASSVMTTDSMTPSSGSTGGSGPEEGGPPDVNPCAEGESGSLGEGQPPAADARAIDVSAVEYSFEGLDQISETGDYALTLTNEGAQLHEIVLVRINDDETRPLEELLEIEDPSMIATDVAFAFACPGESSEPTAVSIDEPGRYAAVCFIPDGVTPETSPAEFETMGPPHAMMGMAIEFTVP